jgi:hypothetical protein
LNLDAIRGIQDRRLDFQKRKPFRDSDVRDALWRTLVANRGANGAGVCAPGLYKRMCRECLKHTSEDGSLHIDWLKMRKETPSTMVSFLKRVEQVTRGKRFRTVGDKLANKSVKHLGFGIGPWGIKEGDLVRILFGFIAGEGKEKGYSFLVHWRVLSRWRDRG